MWKPRGSRSPASLPRRGSRLKSPLNVRLQDLGASTFSPSTAARAAAGHRAAVGPRRPRAACAEEDALPRPDRARPPPLSPAELADAMVRLGYRTQAELADAIGVSRSSVSLWLDGKIVVPRPVSLLVRMLLAAHRSSLRGD